MFANAYQIAASFTLPVVISSRAANNVCSCSIGGCVVVNKDGWVLTTKHMLDAIERLRKSSAQHSQFGNNIRQLEQDTVADKRFRKNKIRTFKRPPANTIKNHSVWWGRDGAVLREATVMPAADLALVHLQPFDGDSISNFPVFQKPNHNYTPGKSLCKLGFPFHNITPSFDEQRNAFLLPAGATPLPLFPMEGMFTRVVMSPPPDAKPPAKNSTTLPPQGKYIETSSPGLVGQSGGPIIDATGAVWALQSHTRHYPLGFSPPAPGQDGAQKEHQFLNVGMGVHVEQILGLLESRGVGFEVRD